MLGFARFLALAGLCVCLNAWAAPARAQYSMIGDSPSRFEWSGRVDADFRNEFETKTDGGDEFDARRIGLAATIGGPINESILLGFRAGYRHSSYDFNLNDVPPLDFGGNALPRDPWNTINTVDLQPTVTALVGNRVSVIAAVPIRYAGESGSDRNGFSAGISALIRWQINDAISVGAGIGVTSQLEDNAETFPLISLKWLITDGLTLATEGSWIQGGNATLLWGANEAVRLTLSAGYERVRFRLDDNGNAADTNGIGEVTAVPIEVGIRFQFVEYAYFDFRVGLAVGGHLRVETDNGRKLYDEQYDPAPRIGLSLTIPFGPSKDSGQPPAPY
jgi:hypothetical protein